MEHIWSRLGQSVLDWPKLETPLLLMSIKLESSNFYQQINELVEIVRLLLFMNSKYLNFNFILTVLTPRERLAGGSNTTKLWPGQGRDE